MGVAGGIPQYGKHGRSHVNAITLLKSEGFDFILNLLDFKDVLLDFLDGSQFELIALVRWAETTTVPRAIARRPDEQGVRFTRRANGTLFERLEKHVVSLRIFYHNYSDGRRARQHAVKKCRYCHSEVTKYLKNLVVLIIVY
jgi:hypothetical protein